MQLKFIMQLKKPETASHAEAVAMATGHGIAVLWRKALTMSIGRIKRHRYCRGIAYDVLDAEGKPVITGLNLYGRIGGVTSMEWKARGGCGRRLGGIMLMRHEALGTVQRDHPGQPWSSPVAARESRWALKLSMYPGRR